MTVSTGDHWALPHTTGPDLEKLYARYWTPLINYINKRLSDRHMAEEIVQETMLRAWRHADKLDPERGSVQSWLCRVAHNIMVDRIRRKHARPAEVYDTSASHEAYAIGDHASAVGTAVDVQRAIAQLSPIYRTVLRLIYFDGRTCAEAAEILGIPSGTVRSRVHYALRQLRTALEDKRFADG
jgi:RNA polymerase sigma-70 factor, ECF subfamily